jgi:hypothetical protein
MAEAYSRLAEFRHIHRLTIRIQRLTIVRTAEHKWRADKASDQ